MGSHLSKLRPLPVASGYIPSPVVRQNIDTLRDILDEVVRDWHVAVDPWQRKINEAPHDSLVVVAAITALRPIFLKCLFSYALFAVSLEGAYVAVFRDLRQANRELGLRVKEPKKPSRTSEFHKIERIRNCSIAHFPSSEADPIDSLAAMSWGLMKLDSASNLERLTFGGFTRVATDLRSGQRVRSKDLEVSGLSQIHGFCSGYFDSYSNACATFLQALFGAHKLAVAEKREEAT